MEWRQFPILTISDESETEMNQKEKLVDLVNGAKLDSMEKFVVLEDAKTASTIHQK